MSNLIPFDMTPVPRGSIQVPAHIAAAQAEMASNITARASIPQLRFKGKTWTVDMNGEQTILTQSDGETPVAIVKMVIMASNPNRSRAYYEGAYDPDKVAAPTCRSVNGVVPDEDVETPCAKSCAACPNSKKGSKISDNGKPSVACAAFKRIAVVPSNDLNFDPLFLRLPQTSMWDGNNSENEAKGWYAYDQYLKFLAERGCSVTSLVVTAIKFDPREAYPKLLFKAEGWLGEEDVTSIRIIMDMKDAEIEAIIGVPTDAKAEARPKLAAPVAASAPAPAAAAPAPAPAAAPAPKPKATPKAAPKVVEAEEADATPASPAATAAPAANALASVLGGWDD